MNNYVSWKILNSYISIPEYNEFEVYKWVYNALRTLNTRDMYQQKVVSLEIKDHKVSLPEDLIMIEELAHFNKKQIDNNILKECKECVEVTVLPTNTQQTIAILPMLPYSFLKTNYYKDSFTLLKPLKGAFSSNLCISSSMNRCCNSSATYEIDPSSNTLITHTIKEGIIVLSYLSVTEDSEGDLMIPNDGNLFETLAAYVKYKYWEVEKQMADYNNYNRCATEYGLAKREFNVRAVNYRGRKVMENLDPEYLKWYSQDRVTNLLRSRL